MVDFSQKGRVIRECFSCDILCGRYNLSNTQVSILICFIRLYSQYLAFRVIYIPIFFRVASLALGQTYDCPSACEVIPKDMGNIDQFSSTTNTTKREPCLVCNMPHYDVIKWNRFPRYWPFVRGIHRSPANSSHRGQWRGALVLSLICAWTNGWVNNRDAGDLRCHRSHYDVTVMFILSTAQLLMSHSQSE